jgi:hypothetical protein
VPEFLVSVTPSLECLAGIDKPPALVLCEFG